MIRHESGETRNIVRRSRRMREVEDRLGEPLDVAIRRLYLQEKRTIPEVAEVIEEITSIRVNPGTLAAWMVRLRATRKDLVAEVAARALAESEPEVA